MTTETMALPKEKTALPAEKFGIEDYAGTFRETRNAYQQQANELEQATGPDPNKAARDAYVAATNEYTESLYKSGEDY